MVGVPRSLHPRFRGSVPRSLRGSAVAGLVASLMAASLSVSPVGAAEPIVPGADESPAVRRETVLELSNPAAPDRLPELKSKAAGVISARQIRLTQLAGRVSGREADCARGELAAAVAADVVALNSLSTQLAAETDVKRAKDLYRRLFTDLRIYGLDSPRVYLSGACSAVLVRAAAAQVRIAALTTDPPRAVDPALLTAASAELGSRVLSAVDKADAATEVLVDLVPDKGEKAVLVNNTAVLRATADQIRAAEQELVVVETSLDTLRRPGAQRLKDVRDAIKDARAERKAAAAANG
jgi:hypothetical protein